LAIIRRPYSKGKNPIEITDIKVIDENLELALTLTQNIFKDEEERRKGIEGKAALLLGTIGIAVSVVGASAYIVG